MSSNVRAVCEENLYILVPRDHSAADDLTLTSEYGGKQVDTNMPCTYENFYKTAFEFLSFQVRPATAT